MTQPQDPDAGAPNGGVRVHASLPTAERRSRIATAISFLLHALLIYFAIRLTAAAVMPAHSPIGDAIQMVLGGGGGGGGQGGQAFQHPAVPPPPPVAPPVLPPPPTTVPPPPPVQQSIPRPAAAPDAPASAATVAAGGSGTGSGGGNGSGVGSGNGSGRGPGSGSGSGGGEGNGATPPDSKQLIIPGFEGKDLPKEYRGKTFIVTFYISATGSITDLTIVPTITNRAFAKKIDEEMRGYTFKPGRDAAGNKVAGTYVYELNFGSQ